MPQGRLLHLIPGKIKAGEDGEEEGVGADGASYKKKKAKKEKAAAGSSHNWNSLFLGRIFVLLAEKRIRIKFIRIWNQL